MAATNPAKSRRSSLTMERTGQWVLSRDLPTDVVVQVGEANFCLHKMMLATRSGNMRELVTKSADVSNLMRIDLSEIPGGPEIFEKVAKFCYGVEFEITVRNVAALRCAAEYLDMSEECFPANLIAQTEEFLVRVALSSFTGAIAVLKSCEELLPIADDVKLVQRCVEAASLKAYTEANFQTRSPPGWWMDEVSILSPEFFKRFMISLKARGTKSQTLATVVMAYTDRNLRELIRRQSDSDHDQDHLQQQRYELGSKPEIRQTRQRLAAEAAIATMPSGKTAFPVSFLCCLLRATIALGCSVTGKNAIISRISALMEHVTVEDLLAVEDVDSVRQIITGFIETENKVTAVATNSKSRLFKPQQQDQAKKSPSPAPVLQNLTRTIDAYLAEIATCPDLSISKFTGLASSIPKPARKSDDDLYRAIDIYLKSHPSLDEIEREKICSPMDPLNLSYEARSHASQNKRLPVQIVLHALYFDQLKLRGSDAEESNFPDDASVVRNQVNADVSLIRENEALRMELEKMRQYVTGMQQTNNVGQCSSSTVGKTWKKPAFFSSVTRTLGKLNPFRNGSKDTLEIERMTCRETKAVKPRRKRFSIS